MHQQPNPADYYKTRIDEMDRNFNGLRDVEWKTNFYVFTAYGAIAFSYHQIRFSDRVDSLKTNFVLNVIATLSVLLVFFLVTVYFGARIQERLLYNRARRNAILRSFQNYCGITDEMIGEEKQSQEEYERQLFASYDGNRLLVWLQYHNRPIHQGKYAYYTNMIASGATGVILLGYIYMTRPC